MTVGDGESGGDVAPVPLPRRVPGAAGAIPITLRTAASDRSGTTVLDAVPPPWMRVPDPPARPTPLRSVAAPPDAVPAARPAAPTGPPRPVTRVAAPLPSPHRARPRIVEEPGILGLSRLSRSRFGSRLFTLFFVAVFAIILVEMLVTLLHR